MGKKYIQKKITMDLTPTNYEISIGKPNKTEKEMNSQVDFWLKLDINIHKFLKRFKHGWKILARRNKRFNRKGR